MAEVADTDRVVLLGPVSRRPLSPAPERLDTTESASEDDAGEPAPTIDIIEWTGAEAFEDRLAGGWDVIVGLPPQGAERAQEQLAKFLEIATRRARPGARAVLLFGASLLAGPSPVARQLLLREGSVAHLVFPEGGLPSASGIHSAFRTVLAGWWPTAATERTRVAALTADGLEQHRFETVLRAADRWTHASLDPRRAELLTTWATRTRARSLGELVSFPRGEQATAANLRLIGPRHVTRAGIDLDAESRSYDKAADGALVRLRDGDIVGRTIGDPYWALVEGFDDEPLGAGRQLIIIRPTAIESRYLLTFLKSDAAARQLDIAAAGTTIPRVSLKGLRSLLVPTQPAGRVTTESDQVIRSFRKSTAELSDELDSRYRGAFDATSAEAIHAALADATGRASMALDLVRRASDPLYRARQFMPHPLARTIRAYENDLEGGSAQDLYGHLIRFGETAITLLGIVGLSYIRTAQPLNGELERWTARLSGGVPLGSWLAGARAGAKLARSEGEPLEGLASAMSTESVLDRALAAFLEERNELAHGAGPRSPYEYERRAAELQEKLAVVVDALSPLARAQWFVLSSLRWSRSSQRFTLVGRSLSGDHPDFGRWESEHPQPLESGVVYARFGDLDLSLAGFCQLRGCGKCLNEELYYPDRLRGSIVRLRSLDRGHQAQVPAEELGLDLGGQ